jgi:PKD repeat protein
MAEPSNAIKDAIISMQVNLGTTNPSRDSLNYILSAAETTWLSPKPVFRAIPSSGPAPLTVKFQNFSTGDAVRFLWDFGDGESSVETAPSHTYEDEGQYTVKLNMITSLGAQGIVTKEDYIIVDNSLRDGFYYITPSIGTTATQFTFIDQTVGDVVNRYWIFDDGNSVRESNPNIHTTTHTYSSTGTYNTALIVDFSNQSTRRYITDPIIVS